VLLRLFFPQVLQLALQSPDAACHRRVVGVFALAVAQLFVQPLAVVLVQDAFLVLLFHFALLGLPL